MLCAEIWENKRFYLRKPDGFERYHFPYSVDIYEHMFYTKLNEMSRTLVGFQEDRVQGMGRK
jgi:hypothetical protein